MNKINNTDSKFSHRSNYWACALALCGYGVIAFVELNPAIEGWLISKLHIFSNKEVN